MAVCLLEVGDEAQKQEAAKLMDKVPGLRQKIAGKSIPLEVCQIFHSLDDDSKTFHLEICGP